MKSKKTRIEKKLKRKTNPELVETIIASKKHKEWIGIGNIISGSRRNSVKVNIEKINNEAKEGDIVVVPGKVLSTGKIDKKVRVAALGFSEEAKRKLKEKKCEIISILKEIKENPHAKAVRVIN